MTTPGVLPDLSRPEKNEDIRFSALANFRIPPLSHLPALERTSRAPPSFCTGAQQMSPPDWLPRLRFAHFGLGLTHLTHLDRLNNLNKHWNGLSVTCTWGLCSRCTHAICAPSHSVDRFLRSVQIRQAATCPQTVCRSRGTMEEVVLVCLYFYLRHPRLKIAPVFMPRTLRVEGGLDHNTDVTIIY